MKFHWMKKLGTLGFFAALMFSSTGVKAQDGEALFKANCQACHKVDKASVGPKLQGAKALWEEAGEGELIYEWIADPAALVSSGKSKRAKEVEAAFSGAMTPQGHLSREEMDAILSYADSYVAPVKETGGGDEVASADSGDDGSMVIWVVVLLCVLLVIIFAGIGVKKQLAHVVNEREGIHEDVNKSIQQQIGEWIVRNWKLTLVLFLVIVVSGGADVFTRLARVGVFEDYQPSQPIAYSHKLHAGDMGIDCKYCHSSAETSKHAGIPSTNVCMNCHNMVTEGTTTGTREISKIHAAAGYDGENMKYNTDEEGNVIQGDPIVWNKAHNLPDHVFFSHAQHVNPNTGNVDCKQCHGDVATFGLGRVATVEEINALAADDPSIIPLTKPLLTMGWCIECHKEKGIDVIGSDNGYYQELHNRLKNRPEFLGKITEDDKVSVEELGGWECAKCHY